MKDVLCPGFKAAGIASGLKKNKAEDLGLIFSETPAAIAGVFTQNQVQAAPVLLDRERIKSGLGRAIVANSGNANCCTGEKGIRDAEAMANAVAEQLAINEKNVFVASTGVIGLPLPMEKIIAAVPDLIAALRADGTDAFARAIMTTDTVKKVVARQGKIGDKLFHITGIAKGAGMICPDMATMLCFICTDVCATTDALQRALKRSVNSSFNRITIDGDTSTNDTVLLMANGWSQADIESPQGGPAFQSLLDAVLIDLARQLVKDGEGATKLVEVAVKGAASEKEAHQAAQTIANSPLFKTALFGEDANWGRIAAALGRADIYINPNTIDIAFDDVVICRNTSACGLEAEAQAAKIMQQPEFTVTININCGTCCASVLTCDYSIDYVKINADYRS
jgi:glutamate N-acetyltransferase/amino-acid N-acetyltransferase